MGPRQVSAGGKIILLNGASSSGKSTLAHALQGKIELPFWHISIDHLRDAGVLPLDRIRNGEFIWRELREPFFEGFHLALPAYARAGNNLIVEHIVETRIWMQRLIHLLSAFDVFFVGIHCNVDELERREALRGDRHAGDARRDSETVHQHAAYDLEIDSTQALSTNVDNVLRAWRSRQSPSAFARMARDAEY